MKFHTQWLLLLVLSLSALAQAPELGSSQRLQHFNLEKHGLALDGYDPVSYFSGDPQVGKKSITATYGGVVYRFANHANLEAFEANPSTYEPAYGGWCATAMLSGDRVGINPKYYKIVDGKLLLFYKGLLGNALKDWEQRIADGTAEAALIQAADEQWQQSLQP